MSSIELLRKVARQQISLEPMSEQSALTHIQSISAEFSKYPLSMHDVLSFAFAHQERTLVTTQVGQLSALQPSCFLRSDKQENRYKMAYSYIQFFYKRGTQEAQVLQAKDKTYQSLHKATRQRLNKLVAHRVEFGDWLYAVHRLAETCMYLRDSYVNYLNKVFEFQSSSQAFESFHRTYMSHFKEGSQEHLFWADKTSPLIVPELEEVITSNTAPRFPFEITTPIRELRKHHLNVAGPFKVEDGYITMLVSSLTSYPSLRVPDYIKQKTFKLIHEARTIKDKCKKQSTLSDTLHVLQALQDFNETLLQFNAFLQENLAHDDPVLGFQDVVKAIRFDVVTKQTLLLRTFDMMTALNLKRAQPQLAQLPHLPLEADALLHVRQFITGVDEELLADMVAKPREYITILPHTLQVYREWTQTTPTLRRQRPAIHSRLTTLHF